MATRQSNNYGFTLQDNDEFVDIETTAANFEIVDTELKKVSEKAVINASDISSLEAAAAKLEKDIAALKASQESGGTVSAETAAKITALESQLTTVNANITNLKTRVSTLEGKMTTAEGDIDTLESDMDAAESDIDNLESKMTSAEGDIDALESDMDNAEKDIDNLENKMSTAETDIDNLEAEVESIKSQQGSGGEELFSGVIRSGTTGQTIKNLSKYRVVLIESDSTIILGTVQCNSVYCFIIGCGFWFTEQAMAGRTEYSVWIRTDTSGIVDDSVIAHKIEGISPNYVGYPVRKIIGIL